MRIHWIRGMAGAGLLVALLCGCDQAPDAASQAEMSGRELFVEFCSGCHGELGQGKLLSGVPANRNTQLSRAEIMRLLREGSRSERHPMPAVPDLDPRQMGKVADYVIAELPKESAKGK